MSSIQGHIHGHSNSFLVICGQTDSNEQSVIVNSMFYIENILAVVCVKTESNFRQKILATRPSRFQVQAGYFTFPIRIEISKIKNRIFRVFKFSNEKNEIRGVMNIQV